MEEIKLEQITNLPQDMIDYIGKYYNPKIEIALKRILKLKNKLVEN